MASSSVTRSAATRNPTASTAPAMAAVAAISCAVLLLHLWFNNRYGYFRDEFDYISCGNHLAWGYVDQPPLIPFLARISILALGDSLRAVRFIPALASSLLVFQTALLARELGGRTFAVLLSAVTIVIAPQYLSNGSLLGTNCLEPNLWMGCVWFAILAIRREDPRYWFWFGIALGIGLEEKYTIGLFGFSIVVGLLFTPERRAFFSRWFWLGGAAALLVFSPNLIWNINHHWPFLELTRNIKAAHRDVVLPAGQYLLQQMLLIHPVAAPIWICGLVAFLISPRLKSYRLFGWSYLICYAVLFALHGKNYYLAAIYPILLAGGAVTLEAALDRSTQPWAKWTKPAILSLLLASGACLLPITVPLLSPDRFLVYVRSLPFRLPVMEHSHARAKLPQWYADQFGWEEIVAKTAQAWRQLSPEERGDCGIFAQNYGQAGAIDFLGGRYGLPPALSGHQTWFLWGPRRYTGNCLIVLDDRREVLERLWRKVDYVGTSAANPYALEQQLPVFICRGAKFGTLAQFWPTLKHWR